MRYSQSFIRKIKEDARKAPAKRFPNGAAMMAYLNKPVKKKVAVKLRRS